jgi:hypothetical protein
MCIPYLIYIYQIIALSFWDYHTYDYHSGISLKPWPIDSFGGSGTIRGMARLQAVIPIERIASRIYLIRDEKVMLDNDLAELIAFLPAV